MDLKVCRICGGFNQLKYISDQDHEMLDKLLLCANVKIHPDDMLPKFICQLCDNNLEVSYRFRKQSEATQKRLSLEIKRQENEDPSIQLQSNCKLEFKCIELEIEETKINATSTNYEVEEKNIIPIISDESYHDNDVKVNNEMPSSSENCIIDLLSSSPESTGSECSDESESERNDVSALTCSTCHETFIKKKDYSLHIKQHGDERYQCIQCCKSFPTKYRLRSHEEIHNDIPSYQCSYCMQSYRSIYNLKRHIKSVHLGEKKFECNLCNLKFSRADVLKRHLKLHTDKKNYKCSFCSQSFKTMNYLYAHNESNHSEKSKKSPSTKRSKNDETKISKQCGYCGKMFKSLFVYKNHILIHTNEKPYECETCEKKFRTIASLTVHQRIHDDFRPYQCELCLKSFRQMSHLKDHKILHLENVPQHSCSICQTSFTKKSNLKAHMRIHSKEKPFKCADCSAEFSYLHLLQRHAGKVHKRCVYKVYTVNTTDEIYEMEETEHVKFEQYQYIDTEVDDNCDNNAEIDFLPDSNEIYTSFLELETNDDQAAAESEENADFSKDFD